MRRWFASFSLSVLLLALQAAQPQYVPIFGEALKKMVLS